MSDRPSSSAPRASLFPVKDDSLTSQHHTGIYTIESGVSFIDTLADVLLQTYQNDDIGLSRVRVLLPTRRACTALRDAFLRRSGGRAVILPAMAPVFSPDEEELYFLSGLDVSHLKPAIDPTRRLLLLMPLIQRAFPESLNTQQALALSAHLASFIDNLYIEDLQLDDLDRLAPDDPKLALNWQKTVVFLKTIIAEFWPDILAETGCVDVGAYRVSLIKAYTAYWQNHAPQDPVIIAGTMASIPALADMIKSILAYPQGHLILPGLDTDMDQESWDHCTEGHPQYLLKQLLGRLDIPRHDVQKIQHDMRDINHDDRYAATPPQVMDQQMTARRALATEIMRPPQTLHEWIGLQGSSPKAQMLQNGLQNMALAEVKNAFSEARLIACILRECLDIPDHTVMVMTPNRKLAALIQKEMLFWGVTLDDSAGQPLAQTGLGRWFLAFVRLMKDQCAPLHLLAVLKNGFFRGGVDWPVDLPMPDFVTRFEKDIMRGMREYQDLDSLDALITEKWSEKRPLFLEAWHSLMPVFTALRDLSASAPFLTEKGLRVILQQMEYCAGTAERSGDRLLWIGDTGEQAAPFFANLLESVRGDTKMDKSAFEEFCTHMLEGLSVRPKYGIHPRIRLLGLAEARLQTADTVIMAGLNEGSWPTDPGHNPWMSRPMIQEYGFPSPERSLSQSAHDFVQGFCSARVFLTRALSMDGALTVPSRWVSRFKAVIEAANLPDPAIAAAPYIQKALLLPIPQQRQTPISRPAPKLPQHAAIEGLYITEAGSLLNDPYAFYARRVLNLKPLDPIDQKPDALLRGELLHKGLELFTSEYRTTLPADPFAEIMKCGQQVFSPYTQWNADIHAFWWPRYAAMAAWFAAHEQHWRQEGQTIFTEMRGHYTFDTAKGDVLMTGRADRIEKHNDGWVVIDYKTGQPANGPDVLMGYAPQLSLTGALILHDGFEGLTPHKAAMTSDHADDIKGLYYWKISGRDSFAKEAGKGKNAPATITDLCEDALSGLGSLLRYYNDEGGAFMSYPLGTIKAAPFSGDYKHLSRVSEWAVADDNEEQEDAA